MRALFSVNPQLSQRPPLTSRPSPHLSPPTTGLLLLLPLYNLMSGVKGGSCGWIISSPVVTLVPQEPVGQRPRHSYSLSLDARPQIQMSSINLFLQEESERGTPQVRLVRGLPPNPATASLLNHLLSCAWGQQGLQVVNMGLLAAVKFARENQMNWFLHAHIHMQT